MCDMSIYFFILGINPNLVTILSHHLLAYIPLLLRDSFWEGEVDVA
jgi:hypothetical protein